MSCLTSKIKEIFGLKTRKYRKKSMRLKKRRTRNIRRRKKSRSRRRR